MNKICIICPRAYPHLANRERGTDGGAEAQLKTLGSAFVKQGFKVNFIVGDYGQRDQELVENIIIHKVPLKYRRGPKYYLPLNWIKLIKTLNSIKADIHLIKYPRDLLLPLGIFARATKTKLIFIGQIDTDADLNLLKSMENIFSYWLFRIGVSFADYVIAQNEKQKYGFSRFYKKECKVIKSILTLPKAKYIHKKGYILWVGNNLPKKQPEKFLNLASHLPSYRFKMIMAPTSTNPSDSSVKELAATIPNLEYFGYVPFSRIGEFFQSASLFVSTSVREGFPNTFLQSWQYGTPVISLHVDPDGLIEKYYIGRHSRTFEKLCSDVRELMENDKLRIKMGENAKKYVQDYHSTDIIIPQYVKLFRNCL